MINDILKERKAKLGITTEELSQLSGVPVGTINKILSGETKSPRYDTLDALKKILMADDSAFPDRIQEAMPAYHVKKQGEYTIDDYRALPDDVRAELIDGNLIFMDAPSYTHQDIMMEILFDIKLFIRDRKGPCKVMPSPLNVQLDKDDKTVVQPDILITCDKEQRNEKGIYGAPDFCLEIISPSTKRKDYGIKTAKYMNAGVHEYWIVDVQRETITTYFFEGEDYPTLYTFQDKVPVRIYDGELEIDFASIQERLG